MNKIMTAEFQGTEHYAFHGVGGVVFVALRPIVEAMGLNWSGQLQRLRRDPILSQGVCVMHTPFGLNGGQESVCLRLDLLNGWLFKIDSTRVRPEARDRVQTYQRKCYQVLYAHFTDEGARLLHERQESEGQRVRMVTEARHTWGTYAAQQLWKGLGLPSVPAMALSLGQQGEFDFDSKKAA